MKLLIVDELGYVPLSPTGAELLFEMFSQRYERGSTIVTSNLPFEEWTTVLGPSGSLARFQPGVDVADHRRLLLRHEHDNVLFAQLGSENQRVATLGVALSDMNLCESNWWCVRSSSAPSLPSAGRSAAVAF